jgi:hypothetical protein
MSPPGFEPITNRGELMISLLQAILPPPYHLINLLLNIANKLGYQKKKKKMSKERIPVEKFRNNYLNNTLS